MSADSTLTCRNCGQPFIFSAGEKDVYASRGYSDPGRCPECRAARKAERDGGSSYGGDRPVYCSACFEKRRGNSDRSGDHYAPRSRY